MDFKIMVKLNYIAEEESLCWEARLQTTLLRNTIRTCGLWMSSSVRAKATEHQFCQSVLGEHLIRGFATSPSWRGGRSLATVIRVVFPCAWCSLWWSMIWHERQRVSSTLFTTHYLTDIWNDCHKVEFRAWLTWRGWPPGSPRPIYHTSRPGTKRAFLHPLVLSTNLTRIVVKS